MRKATKTKTAKPEPLAVSLAEAATMIGVSHRMAWSLVSRGDLRVVRIGRRTIVPVSAIHELLAAGSPPLRKRKRKR